MVTLFMRQEFPQHPGLAAGEQAAHGDLGAVDIDGAEFTGVIDLDHAAGEAVAGRGKRDLRAGNA